MTFFMEVTKKTMKTTIKKVISRIQSYIDEKHKNGYHLNYDGFFRTINNWLRVAIRLSIMFFLTDLLYTFYAIKDIELLTSVFLFSNIGLYLELVLVIILSLLIIKTLIYSFLEKPMFQIWIHYSKHLNCTCEEENRLDIIGKMKPLEPNESHQIESLDAMDLKIDKKYFIDIIMSLKQFEIRKNDRTYYVNQTLRLKEMVRDSKGIKQYTGNSVLVKVTYILDDTRYIKDDYVILGIQLIHNTTNYNK